MSSIARCSYNSCLKGPENDIEIRFYRPEAALTINAVWYSISYKESKDEAGNAVKQKIGKIIGRINGDRIIVETNNTADKLLAFARAEDPSNLHIFLKPDKLLGNLTVLEQDAILRKENLKKRTFHVFSTKEMNLLGINKTWYNLVIHDPTTYSSITTN